MNIVIVFKGLMTCVEKYSNFRYSGCNVNLIKQGSVIKLWSDLFSIKLFLLGYL